MDSTYILLSSTFAVPQSALQWSLIHLTFSPTVSYWMAVEAVMQSNASPIGSNFKGKVGLAQGQKFKG